MQKAQELTNRVAKLNSSTDPWQRLAEKLDAPPAEFQLTLDHVVDELEREHPELLHLLAQ